MRKLIVAEHVSLDGVIQSPGAPKEDPSGDFSLGGWTAPFEEEAIGAFVTDMFSNPFELLLGRATYDIWAAFWPTVPKDSGAWNIADQFNRTAKHVATHRPDTLGWKNSHALQGDPVDAVRALKKSDGPNLLTWGSAHTVRQLLAAALVDELRLIVYPVVLGRGKRLFGDGAQPSAFTLAKSTVTPGGVFVARYVRGGDVRTGTVQS